MKSNKPISWNFFLTKIHFCNFKNGQKSIFELGKSSKLPKMQFYEENFMIYLISRVFCLDVFKFSGPLCVFSFYLQDDDIIQFLIYIHQKYIRKVRSIQPKFNEFHVWIWPIDATMALWHSRRIFIPITHLWSVPDASKIVTSKRVERQRQNAIFTTSAA